MEVEIDPPSPAQMRKLHMGHPFRAKLGKGLKVMVSPKEGKKLMRASMKGSGATLEKSSCCGCGMCGGDLRSQQQINQSNQRTTANTNFSAAANQIAQRQGGSLTSTMLMMGNPSSVNGRGLVKKSNEFAEAARPYTVNKTVSPIKQAASTSAVSAISKKGSGLVKKSNEFAEAARPYTVNKTVSPIKQAASTSAVSAISKKKGSGMEGGKVSRRKKFNKWFKDIGQKFKPIAKNLKPIKEAATERAADYIKYEGNPQAQAQSLIDMGQQEYKDTRKLGNKKRGQSFGSASVADEVYSGEPPVSLRRGSFISPSVAPSAPPPPQAVDVNEDGEADGYFFPNERSWFGAGMKGRKVMRKAVKKSQKGGLVSHGATFQQVRAGMGAMVGRPTIMPVVRPAPTLKASGAKKTSPWIAHVKAYCAKHGCKYGEALKLAKASYKGSGDVERKGGALYPAGYDPRYN